MTRVASSAHRPFDQWEKAIIGAEEIRLDPVVVQQWPTHVASLERPPAERCASAPSPAMQRTAPPGQVPASASPLLTQALAPVYDRTAEQPAVAWQQQSSSQGGEAQAPKPEVRRWGRWRRLVPIGLALPALGFVGLVWIGKEKAPESTVVGEAQQPPRFGAPIKLPPNVAPVTAHRPDQLDEAASRVAPSNILAEADADAGAPAASSATPASSPASPSIPLTTPSPAAAVVPPAILVPRVVGADTVPAASTERQASSPRRYATRIPVSPSAGPSGPAGLFAIGAPSARAASAPSRSDPKSEAASEAVVQPMASPKAAAAPTTAPPPDSSGIRRAAYGRSGIVALTPNSVIVYDRDRRTQTEIRAGGTLPDGSKVISVHATSHRVETDRGILELSAPNSN